MISQAVTAGTGSLCSYFQAEIEIVIGFGFVPGWLRKNVWFYLLSPGKTIIIQKSLFIQHSSCQTERSVAKYGNNIYQTWSQVGLHSVHAQNKSHISFSFPLAQALLSAVEDKSWRRIPGHH